MSNINSNNSIVQTNYSFKDVSNNNFDIGKCLPNNVYNVTNDSLFIVPFTLINNFRIFIINETFNDNFNSNFNTYICIVTNNFLYFSVQNLHSNKKMKENEDGSISYTNEEDETFKKNGPYLISDTSYNGPSPRQIFYYNHNTNILHYKRNDTNTNVLISVL